jgi:predicted nucleic acid-binding protein
MTSYLIDTNVILRSIADKSVQHSTAVSAIALLLEKRQELFLAPQVLMELWAVATRPMDVNGFGWPVDMIRGKVDILLDQFPLLPETPAVFAEWLRQVTQRKVIGKQVHDARMVALLNTHGITNLLTFNVGDFKDSGITAISPDEILVS